MGNFGVLFFWGDLMKQRKALLATIGLLTFRRSDVIENLSLSSWKTIGTSEEGFLIPLRGDKTNKVLQIPRRI